MVAAAHFHGSATVRAPDYNGQGYHPFQVQEDSFDNSTGGVLRLATPVLGGSATGNYFAYGSQSLAASATAFGDNRPDYGPPTGADYAGSGGGFLTYVLSVYGPSNVDVPLILKGRLDLTATRYGGGYAGTIGGYSLADGSGRNLLAVTGGTNALNLDCDTGNNAYQCGNHVFESDFSLNSYTNVLAGRSAIVSLQAIAGASAYGVLENGAYVPGQAFATALADPNVIIDPVWAAAHPGYAISFSSGIVNGAALGVPEPASWAFMLTGIGIAGAVVRRRRRPVEGLKYI